MAKPPDITADFGDFQVQFGERGDRVLMWLCNDLGESPGCHLVRRARRLIDRALSRPQMAVERTR